MLDPIEEFRADMAANGYNPGEIVPGKYNRFSTNGDPKDKAGWCIITVDPPCGSYGDWRTGEQRRWSPHGALGEMPPEHRKAMEVAQKQWKAEEAAKHKETAERCARQWALLNPASDEHPYLKTKGVAAYGLKASGSLLVAAYKDVGGVLWTLQYISPDGEKRFEKGGRTKGCFFEIQGEGAAVYLVEGYATGATVHQATGARVIGCGNAGNLGAVAGALRKSLPDVKMVICADDDRHSEKGNPGLEAAAKAARATGAAVASPKFKDCSIIPPAKKPPKDFNDLAQREGIKAVKSQLLPASTCGISMIDLCAKEFPPIIWLLPNIFPTGSLYMAGPPKLGKSVFVTSLAVAVATDGAFGGLSTDTGGVIYLAMEDSERRLKTRIIANLGDRKPTNQLKLITMQDKWPLLGQGCLTRLRQEIGALKNVKLVIIDTLKRIRPKTEKRKQQYDADYDDLTRVHALTVEYPNILFFVIGHTRKMGADDIFDTISGTQGLSGAVDTLAVFAGIRGTGKAKLFVEGRDVTGVKKAVLYDKASYSWNISGDISGIETTENQDKIFKALVELDQPGGVSIRMIEVHSGISIKTIEYNIGIWRKKDIIQCEKRGRYRLCAGALKAGSIKNMLLDVDFESAMDGAF